ncbi:MAG TPA: hypothetical protein VNF68_09385 [Candidatus Baltobacteraceae bacterium]|nr:hypothetical protein [Candidatus Baltobacteraceae bacterium]
MARKIFLRFAQASDVDRLTREGVLTGAPSARETWNQRMTMCLSEQKVGRRAILIAEDETGLLGMVQLVFKLPVGYDDPEAANGMDVAMMETLRLKPGAPAEIGGELVGEVQRLATKRNVKTLTFLISMTNSKGITQAKSWGFEEFRIMPEAGKMLAFFRKSVD